MAVILTLLRSYLEFRENETELAVHSEGLISALKNYLRTPLGLSKHQDGDQTFGNITFDPFTGQVSTVQCYFRVN